MTKPTWRMLVKIEPELARLYDDVRAVRDPGGIWFCANNRWYGDASGGGFKSRLVRLVGFDAQSRDPRMRTMEAYDVAYDKIYAALPPCRDCLCF
jgi:hypothetical protein